MPSTNYLEKRFSKDPSVVFRKIGNECLLVPIGRQAADLNYLFVLNPVGGRIWELIDGQRQVRDIRDQLVAQFAVGSQEAEQDLREFLEQLVEIGGIRET